MHENNVAFRVLVVVVLALGGIIFFPLFFVAAFVAWALFQDLTRPPDPDANEWFVRRWTVTAADPDWKSCFLPVCESPAETAFLEAMIAGHNLVPDKGALSGSGLKVTLQAELAPYRVDFLVNDWLVVEIDGAAYHSSSEAVARDQERDRDLKSRGYQVIRIPAKTVFNTPFEATRQVRGALTAGRPTKLAANGQQKAQAIRPLGQALASLDKFVTDVNFSVEKSTAVQAAMQPSRETFDLEKTAIDGAMEMAVRRQKIQAFRAQSEQHARNYDEAYAEIAALLGGKEPIVMKTVPEISAPQTHQNPVIDAEIKRVHQDLLNSRSEYLQSVRDRLRGDHQLGMLVKNALEELGCPDCWRSISV